jgi:hypothetical protein
MRRSASEEELDYDTESYGSDASICHDMRDEELTCNAEKYVHSSTECDTMDASKSNANDSITDTSICKRDPCVNYGD